MERNTFFAMMMYIPNREKLFMNQIKLIQLRNIAIAPDAI
jgi:hypothetical protein